jgi:branched-chain amino acid aminotransferase
VSPIRSVDRIPVGAGEPGPVARQLQKELLGLAKGERPDPYGWLTPVPRTQSAKSAGVREKVGG